MTIQIVEEGNMPEQDESNTRTRMKVSLTAKGLAQYEVTAEYDTPERTAEELGKALRLVKQTIVADGLTIAS